MTQPSSADVDAVQQAWVTFDLAAERASGASLAGLFQAEPDRLDRLALDAAGFILICPSRR